MIHGGARVGDVTLTLQEKAKPVPARRISPMSCVSMSYRAHEARYDVTPLRRRVTGSPLPCWTGHGRRGLQGGATAVTGATNGAPAPLVLTSSVRLKRPHREQAVRLTLHAQQPRFCLQPCEHFPTLHRCKGVSLGSMGAFPPYPRSAPSLTSRTSVVQLWRSVPRVVAVALTWRGDLTAP